MQQSVSVLWTLVFEMEGRVWVRGEAEQEAQCAHPRVCKLAVWMLSVVISFHGHLLKWESSSVVVLSAVAVVTIILFGDDGHPGPP